MGIKQLDASGEKNSWINVIQMTFVRMSIITADEN